MDDAPTRTMRTDLVLSPFDADPAEFVTAAKIADRGFDGVYTFDHFSGAVAGHDWSRDPFVSLGAAAAATKRVRLGVLVANMVNRHPAQLALAINTLQTLTSAPDRVICGIGAGAGPGSKFAVEQEMVGSALADAATRRAQLVDTIVELRSIWAGTSDVRNVVDDTPSPKVIVGASSRATVLLAAEHADGVNIRRAAPDFETIVTAARSAASRDPFEVSVLDALDVEHPLGGDPRPLHELGVDRRCLYVAAPYPLAAIERIATNLALS